MRDALVAAADVGASKVVVAVARRSGAGLELLGLGAVQARQGRRGNAVASEEIGECLRLAVDEAEVTSGVAIEALDVAIRPTILRGSTQDLRSEVRGGLVQAAHVRALESRPAAAREGHVPLFRSHVGYRVDDQLVAQPPIGRTANRLARREYVVWSSERSIETISRCAGSVPVRAIAPACVAAAWGVTTPLQRERGVAVVDQGAGSTSIAVFRNGCLVHAAVLPQGGEDLTRNVAVSLRTEWEVAEAVKVAHGSATTRAGDPDAEIEIPGVGGAGTLRRRKGLLGQIIEPRLAEVLSEVRRELDQLELHSELDVVLTGGSTVMPGFADVAEQVLGHDVQLGIPGGFDGHVDLVRHPKYAAVVGMLQIGARDSERARCARPAIGGRRGGATLERMRNVILRMF